MKEDVPVSAEGSVEGEGTVEPAAESPPRALILVIERDPHIRALERYFLEDAGYVVDLCADGQEGLARVRALLPVIVISEILVPVLDGLSICRAIKADPLTRHIPVLVLSILSARDRALAAGADVFMRKPLHDRQLIEAVERLVGARRQRPPGQEGGR